MTLPRKIERNKHGYLPHDEFGEKINGIIDYLTSDKTTESWEDRFEKARKEQWNGGNPYWPNWEGVKDFIAAEKSSSRTEALEEAMGVLAACKRKVNMADQIEFRQHKENANYVLSEALSQVEKLKDPK